MKFVKLEDLRVGMRLARPIYSKKGVLLYDRDSQLTTNAIDSVKNFGLLGIYILEPAEPLPPMSEDDIEFERFQTMMVASIQDELDSIVTKGAQKNLYNIVNQILKKFGHNEGKINFYQNLRSREDYVSRHGLNVAILVTMMTHILNTPLEDQMNIIYAALLHDVGKLRSKNEEAYGANLGRDARNAMFTEAIAGCDLIGNALASNGAPVKRISQQMLRLQYDSEIGNDISKMKLVEGSKILLVANRYDELTAMNLSGESESEVKAIKEFLDSPELYDRKVVNALIQSINILFPGVSVELSTGEKALVLAENPSNMLQPTVLSFRDNTILDLSLSDNRDIYVVDIMKTLDNRYIMNQTESGQGESDNV